MWPKFFGQFGHVAWEFCGNSTKMTVQYLFWHNYYYVLLMLRIDRWRLLEFSTKKYVLFTTYFMSSFQITWYFQRTLWPRFDSEKQLYIWVPFYHRGFIYSYSTAIVQLFHSLTGPRSPARAVRLGSRAEVAICLFLNRFGWFLARKIAHEALTSNPSPLSQGSVLKSN